MSRMMSAVRRRLTAVRETGQRGLTLVELLVAMLIFGLLLVLVASAFSTVSRSINLAGATNNNVSLSGLGMTEITKVLRFATTNPVLGQPINSPAFVVAKQETVTVYTYVDADPTNPKPLEVMFSLNAARQLVETRYSSYLVANGYYSFNTSPYYTRILTGTVLAPSSGQPYLFTYQTADGSTIPCPASGLTSAQAATVAAVQVTLKVAGNTTNNKSTPVILSNIVGIPNTGLNRTGQNI